MPNPSELERETIETPTREAPRGYVPGGGVRDFSSAGSTVVGYQPSTVAWTGVVTDTETGVLSVRHFDLPNGSREDALRSIKSLLRLEETHTLLTLQRGHIEEGFILA